MAATMAAQPRARVPTPPPQQAVPAHTPHLVERVGLLTIIMLGESVISISAALADIAWNQSNVIAAVSGFVMVSAIWWIYYDSFHLLEQRRFTTGHSILYSHFFLYVGLAILASLIRHGILGDLDPGDFRQLAVAGTVLFFLGKQYGYYMEVPPASPGDGAQQRFGQRAWWLLAQISGQFDADLRGLLPEGSHSQQPGSDSNGINPGARLLSRKWALKASRSVGRVGIRAG